MPLWHALFGVILQYCPSKKTDPICTHQVKSQEMYYGRKKNLSYFPQSPSTNDKAAATVSISS